MGWGRMLLLGNIGQQMDIEEQRQQITSLRRQLSLRSLSLRSGSRTVDSLSRRVADIEKDNDELRLYLASLVRYLGHKGLVDHNEFSTLVDAVDAEDGKQDGSYGGKLT